MVKYFGITFILALAAVLMALPPAPVLAQQARLEPLLPQAREERPGVAAQTGREGLAVPAPGERTGRSIEPACPPPDERTGRGRVCRPAEELPPVGTPEPPAARTREMRPERPTGPQPGDYPRAFPPYGTMGGGPPPPYGPGLGGRTVGP